MTRNAETPDGDSSGEAEVDDVLDLRYGLPGQCPGCGGQAFLAYIDLGARCSRHECESCDIEWWVSDAKPGVALPAHP